MTQPNVPRQYSNTAVNTTIATPQFGASTTLLYVASNSGYPSLSGQYPFTLRINPGAADEEIVDVTEGQGTISIPWKVVRGRDGTQAKAWNQGTPVSHGFSARDFREIQATLVNAQGLISNSFPVGGIIMWYGSLGSIPTKFKLCDGRAWNQNDGTPATTGAVGAVTTPDLRDRFVYGAGGTKNPPQDVTGGNPSKGGSNALTDLTMPRHTHTILADYTHKHVIPNTGGEHSHQHRYRDGFDPDPKDPTTGYRLPITYTLTGNYTGWSASGFYSGTDGKHGHTTPDDKHKHVINETGGGGTAPTENNMPQYYALAFIMRIQP